MEGAAGAFVLRAFGTGRNHESRTVDAGRSDFPREERRARRGVRRRRGGAGAGCQEALRGRGRPARGDRSRQRRVRDLPPLARGARRGRPAAARPGNPAVRGQGADPGHRGRRVHRGAGRLRAHRPHRRHGCQAGDPAEDPRRRARNAAERLHEPWREDLHRHRQANGQGRHPGRVRPGRGPPAPQRDDSEGKPAQRRPRARHDHGGRPDPARRADPAVALGARVHDRVVPPGSARDRAGPAGDQELRARPRQPRQDRRAEP